MNETINLLGQPDLTTSDMREVVMQTSEPDSTRGANVIVVKTLDSIYENSDLDKVTEE